MLCGLSFNDYEQQCAHFITLLSHNESLTSYHGIGSHTMLAGPCNEEGPPCFGFGAATVLSAARRTICACLARPDVLGRKAGPHFAGKTAPRQPGSGGAALGGDQMNRTMGN